MPKEYESCVKRGGRVRTKKMSGGKYMHFCFIGGKSYAEYVKTKHNPRDKYKESLKKP